MNRCSGCGYLVPPAWSECRKCGTPVTSVPLAVPAPAPATAKRTGLAILPPPPPAAHQAPPHAGFGAPDDALIPGARPRGVVPDTMLPKIDPLVAHAPAPVASRLNPKTIAAGAVALVVVIAAVYAVMSRGGGATEPPTVLAPRPPAAGIPTDLADVVRIAAESSRRTALQTVIAEAGTLGAALTPAELQAAQPNFTWVIGSEPSTTNTVVSITSATGVDVIAVSGTDRDICAFGRWSPTTGSDYVTMAHVPTCSANNAPQIGWSSQPGGSNQDLPGLDGA
jgi:hypothetical protein